MKEDQPSKIIQVSIAGGDHYKTIVALDALGNVWIRSAHGDGSGKWVRLK